MPNVSESELKRQIKSGDFKNAYLFYGNETYLKEYYVSLIRKKAVNQSFEAFNLHMFNGSEKSVLLEDILKDAQMLPMMGDYNLVIVQDYTMDKLKKDIKILEEYFKDCSETTILIFWYDGIELDLKSSLCKKLINLFAKYGTAAELKNRSENEIAALLVNGAKKRSCTLDVNNAKYLISVAGNDLKTLLNELDKLASFAEGSTITREIIDNMATKCLSARIFDLSKYIIAGNSDKAFETLNALLETKEEPLVILAVLGGVYVDMYRVKCAKAAGFSYNDVAEHFSGYKSKMFTLSNASKNSSSISISRLRIFIEEIFNTDIKIKSSAVDNRVLLEELTVKLLLSA